MEIPTSQLVSFIGATVVGFFMWGVKRTIDVRDKEFDEVKKDIHAIKESLPKEYVSKQDFSSSVNEIKSKLDKLLDFIMDNKKG